MTKTNSILLAITEVALIVKLGIYQDFLLTMIVALAQLVVVVAALNFKSREEQAQELTNKKMLFMGAVVIFTVTPFLIFHQSHFEPSTWSEAGLLIQGPYAILLLAFGVFGVLVSALTSLYLRGKQ